jgi:hypothetical protein
VALVTLVAAAIVGAPSARTRSGAHLLLTVLIALPIGAAGAALVLLRRLGIPEALALLSYASVYDAGVYLVGTGASSSWEGPSAGIAALVPVTLIFGLVLVPPLPAVAPLLLGVTAAVTAPLGPLVGSALLGDRTARAPALRRLDSLLVLGPVCAMCVMVMR